MYTATLSINIDFDVRDIICTLYIYISNELPPIMTIEFTSEVDLQLDNLIDFFDPNIINVMSLLMQHTRSTYNYRLNTQIENQSELNTLIGLLNSLKRNNQLLDPTPGE